MLGACAAFHTSALFVCTPHWSSTSPSQLQVPAAIPPPSHTPQTSTALPLFATPSHPLNPAQLELSPPHAPHASVTSPAQLHLPAGMPEPPQTCLQRFKATWTAIQIPASCIFSPFICSSCLSNFLTTCAVCLSNFVFHAQNAFCSDLARCKWAYIPMLSVYSFL